MVGVSAYMLFPNFQTQEFDQNVVENIMDGVTTTSIGEDSDSNITNNQDGNTIIESPIESEPEIENLLNLNQTLVIKDNITSYLLIGSDKRSDESEDGYVEGQEDPSQMLGMSTTRLVCNPTVDEEKMTITTKCLGRGIGDYFSSGTWQYIGHKDYGTDFDIKDDFLLIKFESDLIDDLEERPITLFEVK